MVQATMVRLGAAAVGLAAATAVVSIPAHGQDPQAVLSLPAPNSAPLWPRSVEAPSGAAMFSVTSAPLPTMTVAPSIAAIVAKKLADRDQRHLYQDPLPAGGERLMGSGVYVVPPPPGLVPKVSAQAAVDRFLERLGPNPDLRASRVELRLATDGDFGSPDDASTYRNRLSWVVIITGLPSVLRGVPANMPEEKIRALEDSMTCEATGILDATVLDLLEHVEICIPR